MGRFLLSVMAVAAACFLLPGKVQAASRVQDAGEKLVVVIDPGHGGDNRGTLENGREEKLMTMTTAMAMYEELVQYENVEVYLTRTADVKLSLKDRAEYAQSVGADFLFSIHYNASASHDLFGSEVWVSAFPPYNAYGYQFGNELLKDMRETGLLIRGVKTRLGNDGTDYYGIIRESVALGIPAAIIEHCHVDEERDAPYCASEGQLRQFGRMDATAVAKYFGLKSSVLGEDYSGYPLAEADAGSSVRVTAADETDPDICQLAFADADYEAYLLTLQATAADYDSSILYYSYSMDGGVSFSAREPWPGADALTDSYSDTALLKLPVKPGTWPEVVLRVFNKYDLHQDSECLTVPKSFPLPEARQPGSSAPSERENGGDAEGVGSALRIEGTGNQDDLSGADEGGSSGLGAESAGDEGKVGGMEGTGAEESAGTGESVRKTASLEDMVLPVGGMVLESCQPKGGQKEDRFEAIFQFCLLAAGILLALILLSQAILFQVRRMRRRQIRKELGDSWDQQR